MSDTSIKIPEIKEILTTGLQFGHSTSRWNPKMAKYIFGAKNNIHIIDVVQSYQMLQTAAEFLKEAASKGNVVFVGTKRQITPIIEAEAKRAGAFFVTDRWAGGMFTNLDMIRRSLYRLVELEKMFEEGVEGRTKYEISKLKTEWQRLNRLYSGIKTMNELPSAIVVIDPRFEKVAVAESRKSHVPIVGLADTNCDPDMVDYLIPGNDDAIRSVELVMKVLADAVLAGNEGKGVVHELKDYSQAEVKVIKSEEVSSEEVEEVKLVEETAPKAAPAMVQSAPSKQKRGAQKGILERVKEEAAKKAEAPAKAEEKPKAKKSSKPKAKSKK